ncbi:MAG: RNA-binding protein, partial [archaeon]|nr:RNA-binding protein [archaeon]
EELNEEEEIEEEQEYDPVNDYENLELIEKGMAEGEVDLKDSLAFKEKIQRTGILYLSHIPEGMKVNDIREKLSEFDVNRIYLVPLKKIKDSKGNDIQIYKEGWVEFEDKLMAKMAEYVLNGKTIGGKKNCPFKDQLWTLQYIHKFKWHDLMNSINEDKRVREKKLKAEIAQSRRENEFIMKNLERTKMLNKKKKREQKKEKEEKELDEDKEEDNNDSNEEEEPIENKEEKNNKSGNEKDDLEALNKIKKKFKQKKPIYKK